MKKDTHPEYNSKAKVTCACGKSFSVGSTKKEIQVEICSNCHPFYTGSQQLVDTAGRAERFKARLSKVEPKKKKVRAKKAEEKKVEKKTAKKKAAK